MPFWIAYVVLCAVFLSVGRHTKHAVDAALIITGVLMMRLTNAATFEMSMFDRPIDTVGFLSFWVWLTITGAVAWRRSHLTAFLLGISTIAYIPFVVSNVAITRLGVAAVVSDIPLVLAILVCGNGSFGNPIGSGFTRLRRLVSRVAHGANLSKGKARIAKTDRKGRVNGG